MIRSFTAGAIAAVSIAATAPVVAFADDYVFNRIATFPVFENLDGGQDPLTEQTVAEIVSVTSDNMTLVYTDSAQERIGFVDITNPAAPAPAGFVGVAGEPTSVTVVGDFAYAGINTSPSFVAPSGHLSVIDTTPIGTAFEVGTCDLGGQPDSVAASPDGAYLAVVLENERDEDLGDGGLPQLPGGELLIFHLDGTGLPTDCGAPTRVALTGGGAACYEPSDPEPEFVDVNSDNIAVVTLQENNCIALVDLETASVTDFFDAGTVDLEDIDITEEGVITLVDDLNDVLREPDAVGWINTKRFATANEGDLDGGSRGFTIFNDTGSVAFESFESLEHRIVQHGHYPEGRSENKGNEPEGIEVGRYHNSDYLFVGSERSGVVGVYKLKRKGRVARFKQLLPTGYRPEGLLAIPSRDLFVVAAEEDEIDDKVRSAISIYAFEEEDAAYPTIISGKRLGLPLPWGALSGLAHDRGHDEILNSVHDRVFGETGILKIDIPSIISRKRPGLPLPWGALSGLAPDRDDDEILYSVHDSAYVEAGIFKIDIEDVPARIKRKILLTRDGALVDDLDLEGIVQRPNGGFWLVSEGDDRAGRERDNLLIRTNKAGVILEEIPLPATLVAQIERFGLEGVTMTGRGASERVYVAFQREWQDDPDDHVKIGVYSPNTGAWTFFHYPIDAPTSPNGGWVGLSSIDAIDDTTFVVIERDNQAGALARIKRLYKFSIAGLTPLPHASPLPPLPVVSKTLVRDLIPDLEAPNGQVLEKVEGLALLDDDELCIVNDNDAVDDSNGETQLICFDDIDALGD